MTNVVKTVFWHKINILKNKTSKFKKFCNILMFNRQNETESKNYFDKVTISLKKPDFVVKYP